MKDCPRDFLWPGGAPDDIVLEEHFAKSRIVQPSLGHRRGDETWSDRVHADSSLRIFHSGRLGELRGKVGDGVNQAADFISAASSIPSLNFTPSMTFGNWF